jgi:cytochrome c oxidase cbb3-type subunit III
MNHAISSALAIFAVAACIACSNSSGRPSSVSAPIPPDQVTDFRLLYSQNCAGCHGADGKGGAAIALANSVFLAIADDTAIRRIASNGVPGTPMPAFAQSAGGMLTETQIDALVRGIRAWAKPNALSGQTPPPYTAATPGDPQRGAAVYRTYCSACHGADGRGGSKASSIVNGSYLALVSDRELRTIVIAGRPDLGSPDWRSDVEGRPMSTQEVSDAVAWLSSQRPKFPGQPYSISSMNPAQGESQ